MIRLSKIIVYPIKALPGVEVDSVNITSGGTLENDRRWAIVDEKDCLINGKNNKQVFLLRPSFNLPMNEVSFSHQAGQKVTFKLSDSDGLSHYLSSQLNRPVRLKEDAQQGFPDDVDASGPTVVSQASLEEVSTWYPGLSLEDIRARFRINLELSPAPAFWEDQLFRHNELAKTVRMGSVAIQGSNPCARCSVPVRHQATGESYNGFYDTFIQMREQSRPSWTDVHSFDHWYRLSANTRISKSETGKALNKGDVVCLE